MSGKQYRFMGAWKSNIHYDAMDIVVLNSKAYYRLIPGKGPSPFDAVAQTVWSQLSDPLEDAVLTMYSITGDLNDLRAPSKNLVSAINNVTDFGENHVAGDLPLATDETAGLVVVGKNLIVDEEGRIFVNLSEKIEDGDTRPVSSQAVFDYMNDFQLPEAVKGDDGKSAYEIAVERGFSGSEAEWLESLKGPPGEPGKDAKAPVLGTDYWTPADRAQIVSDILAALPVYNGAVTDT